MKPDFKAMPRKELIAYVLAHRDDDEAIDTLIARRSPDSEATWFAPPKTEEEWQQQMEMMRPILERKPKEDNQQ